MASEPRKRKNTEIFPMEKLSTCSTWLCQISLDKWGYSLVAHCCYAASHSHGFQRVVSAGNSPGWRNQVIDGSDSILPLANCIINLGCPVWLMNCFVSVWVYFVYMCRCSWKSKLFLQKKREKNWKHTTICAIWRRLIFLALTDIGRAIHLWCLSVCCSLTM